MAATDANERAAFSWAIRGARVRAALLFCMYDVAVSQILLCLHAWCGAWDVWHSAYGLLCVITFIHLNIIGRHFVERTN